MVSKFFFHKKNFDFKNYFQKLKKLSIDIVSYREEKYPKNLLGLEDAPTILYIKGKILETDIKSIAVVGARKNTLYGETIGLWTGSGISTRKFFFS